MTIYFQASDTKLFTQISKIMQKNRSVFVVLVIFVKPFVRSIHTFRRKFFNFLFKDLLSVKSTRLKLIHSTR